MPSVVIDICRSCTPAEETALMDAVFAALMEAFGVPADTRNVVLQVHAPHRFAGRPGCSDSTRLTNVSLFVQQGRSLAAKRRLYASVVRRLGELGVPADCVLIKLHALPAEDFGVRGGQAACDVELGYPLTV